MKTSCPYGRWVWSGYCCTFNPPQLKNFDTLGPTILSSVRGYSFGVKDVWTVRFGKVSFIEGVL